MKFESEGEVTDRATSRFNSREVDSRELDALREEEAELAARLESTRREIDSRCESGSIQGESRRNDRTSRENMLSDENIQQAWDELNNPQRRTGEMEREYNACTNASIRQQQVTVDTTRRTRTKPKERSAG